MSKASCFSLLIFSIFGFLSCQRFESTEVDLSQFQIQDGFKIELIASEPLITDPVAMEIDENGTIYVVEMPGYPLDVTGSGKVKILKDNNGDGIPDESIVFAEDLILPNGIMRWKNGVIVTDAPDVIYLEDADGDGKADKREVLITGFSRSNPQHNMNTPKFGLDNWIYLGHEGAFITKTFEKEFGGRGEAIRFPNLPDSPTLPPNANKKCVRFQPDKKRLEMLSGYTQFGYAFDNWGNRFYTSNANHLFHEVISSEYLEGNKFLPLKSARNYIPDYGPGAEIYPITQNPQHQLLTDVGVITSSCGLTWYQGGLFGDEYENITFIGEPVHNLIHTDKIVVNGATFKAQRHLEKKEFLASEDSWFRPVNFYIGPDGNLYVLDYYRQYIEHPEWMAKAVVESGALYNGMDKGRIYKISPNGFMQSKEKPNLSILSDEELIPLLKHQNIWWRRNAQRLLVDHQNKEIVEKLKAFALSTESGVGLVHALWTLEGLGDYSPNLIFHALNHQEAGVRENAIKIAELHWESSSDCTNSLLDMKDDPDPKVRFQLLCTLSKIDIPEKDHIQKSILLTDIDDEWIQIAALAGINIKEKKLIDFIVNNVTENQQKGAAQFLSKICQMVVQKGALEEVKTMLHAAASSGKINEAWWKDSVLTGLANGMTKSKLKQENFEFEKTLLIKNFHANSDNNIRRSSLNMLSIIGLPKNAALQQIDLAERVMASKKEAIPFRIDAITLLSIASPEKYIKQFSDLVSQSEPIDIQKTGLQALSTLPYEIYKIDEFIFENWEEFTPDLQRAAISILMKKVETMNSLLTAVESGKLHKSKIPWQYQVGLLNNRQDSIKARARIILADNEQKKEGILAEFKTAIDNSGNWENGKMVFAKNCSICHQVGGKGGVDFGPDLASIKNRTKIAILTDIISPNNSIADGYEVWEITLTDDSKKYGIISEEVNENIILKDAGGNEIIIGRKDISSLIPIGNSAMPEGLDSQISVEEMKDLLTYLKNPYLTQ
ncbi:PVC-type heme-binding CxxCH protein [Flexithrix dorotheae]|uniref:PVC-type heme-binding CxxCH protein n=1 Tax=Flexithrix dorotheae TaxID=70993 RepID=UPI000376707C|nr:PVC-type heme-binding CxxCH protein [Flexithrix dorotheae]